MSKLTLPTYPITSIPTGGIAYPENWSIEIPPYSFAQSSGVKETDFTQKRFYNYILDGVRTNFDKSLLVLEDVFLISMARKLVSSKSSKVTLTSSCPECLNNNKITLSLQDAIKFEKCKITNRDKYPLKVQFSKYIGWYRHLTLDESLQMMKNISSEKSTGSVLNIVKRTVKLVELVGEDKVEKVLYEEKNSNATDKDTKLDATDKDTKLDEDSLKSLYETFIDDDAETLDEILDIFESMKLLPIKVTCQDDKCGAVYNQELNMRGLTEYLTPFRGNSEKQNRNTIDL